MLFEPTAHERFPPARQRVGVPAVTVNTSTAAMEGSADRRAIASPDTAIAAIHRSATAAVKIAVPEAGDRAVPSTTASTPIARTVRAARLSGSQRARHAAGEQLLDRIVLAARRCAWHPCLEYLVEGAPDVVSAQAFALSRDALLRLGAVAACVRAAARYPRVRVLDAGRGGATRLGLPARWVAALRSAPEPRPACRKTVRTARPSGANPGHAPEHRAVCSPAACRARWLPLQSAAPHVLAIVCLPSCLARPCAGLRHRDLDCPRSRFLWIAAIAVSGSRIASSIADPLHCGRAGCSR